MESKVTTISRFAIFSSLIIILVFTPLGCIPIGAISLTTAHIPVIVGAIVFKYKFGIGLGGVMGLSTLLRAALMPSAPLDVFFLNPMVSLFPRLFIGIVAYFSFNIIYKYFKNKKSGLPISIGIASMLGTITNTILVMSILILIYADKIKISVSSAIPIFISSIFLINCTFEIIVAIILVIPISLSLFKIKNT